MENLTKLCPTCGIVQQYSSKYTLLAAIQKNSSCKKCACWKLRPVNKRPRKALSFVVPEGVNFENLTKQCPTCGNTQQFRSRKTLLNSLLKNHSCWNCAEKAKTPEQRKCSDGQKQYLSNLFSGRQVSQETRQKMSVAKKGKTAEEIWGKEAAERLKQRGKESVANGSLRFTGHQYPEYKRKRRQIAIARIERLANAVYPNYNPDACKLIDNYGKQHGYNFQHAENGGEFHIQELGYFVDGYDVNKNAVIEVYESHHVRTMDKDKQRIKEIQMHLNCKIIILWV